MELANGLAIWATDTIFPGVLPFGHAGPCCPAVAQIPHPGFAFPLLPSVFRRSPIIGTKPA